MCPYLGKGKYDTTKLKEYLDDKKVIFDHLKF